VNYCANQTPTLIECVSLEAVFSVCMFIEQLPPADIGSPVAAADESCTRPFKRSGEWNLQYHLGAIEEVC